MNKRPCIGTCGVCRMTSRKDVECITVDVGYGRRETRYRTPQGGLWRNPSTACFSCGATVELELVKGHVTDEKCGEKCRMAKRGDCECSCGGANHGNGWAVSATEAEPALCVHGDDDNCPVCYGDHNWR